MNTYKQWRAGAITRQLPPQHLEGFNHGSQAAWEYRDNSFAIQQRMVSALRKELDRALAKGAKAVKANQQYRQRADRVERENRALAVELRIAREERDHSQLKHGEYMNAYEEKCAHVETLEYNLRIAREERDAVQADFDSLQEEM